MVRTVFRAAFLMLACLAPAAAQAGLTVSVDLSSQSMTVAEDGAVTHRWSISSGRIGYRTPNGVYRPQRLARMHYSRKYGMSPMPHTIFFRGGYAIHGTGELRRLGRTASHGCIRLSPGNAAQLYSLVQAYGRSGTRIAFSGSATVVDGGAARRPAAIARARLDPTPIRLRPRYASLRPTLGPRRRFDDSYEGVYEPYPYPAIFAPRPFY
jgi:hypothetical protein